MHLIVIPVALVVLAMMSSTPEGRAEARERLKPVGRLVGLMTLGIWAVVFLPMLFK